MAHRRGFELMDGERGETTPDYRLEDQVGFLLRRATQRHLAIFSTLIPDLTARQFAALVKLYEHGEISQNHLGRETAMDAATIKGVIDRLRKRGLIDTAADPDDSRRLLLSPSRQAKRAIAGLVARAGEVTQETLAPLTDAECETLNRLLRKIG